MENNCLVTKLKGIVNNSNLLKLGEFKLPMQQPNDKYSSITGNNLIIKALKNNMIDANGAHVDYSTQLVRTTSPSEFTIYSIYNVTEIENLIVPSGFFRAAYNLTKFNGELTADFSINDFKSINRGIAKLIILGNRANFDNKNQNEFIFISELTSLTYFSVGAESSVVGYEFNTEFLGKCLPLKEYNMAIAFDSHGAKGSIEELVAGFRTHHLTSDNHYVTINVLNNLYAEITFNNQVVEHGIKQLNWTASTITLNGIEISNSDIAQ